MHSAQPLDILFEEAGASLGRIERELRLKDEARAARFEARLAAIELAAFKAEEDRQRKFEARMAELRDGKDGEPGREGKDADIAPILDEVDRKFSNIDENMKVLGRGLIDQVEKKLAGVKNGKDGEPGKDGKDSDISHLEEKASQHLATLTQDFAEWAETINGRLDARLAEVKDGKDGEPGKDADIEPIRQEFSGLESHLRNNLEASLDDALDRINAKLTEVKDGVNGQPGPPGKDGKDGQDGKMPIAREWTNRVHYAGDVVRHAGATYQALTDTGREPPHGDWGELASRGTDGRGFVLRGTYDASAEYRQHDIVMINRNSFAARYDNPGECPGDGWTLFACSGYKGKEGPPGQQGPKGADGRSVSITKWEADPDEMVITVTDTTGAKFALDLQPIAERILEAAR